MKWKPGVDDYSEPSVALIDMYFKTTQDERNQLEQNLQRKLEVESRRALLRRERDQLKKAASRSGIIAKATRRYEQAQKQYQSARALAALSWCNAIILFLADSVWGAGSRKLLILMICIAFVTSAKFVTASLSMRRNLQKIKRANQD